MLLRRIVIFCYLLLFVGVTAWSGAFFWQARREYNRLRGIEEQTRQKLAEVDAKLAEQERVLRRLRSDPAYVEMVIRRRLGYALPEEFIFRFEE